ncbi:unnamed protein product [Polarella glacialis]|uniref:Uncharacterized protein n=1 Tax=Polarella glacialis TaxID=89957 RepID=A0A813IIL9_POLGL|nr:unnamed protein product [Polarella glacialis]
MHPRIEPQEVQAHARADFRVEGLHNYRLSLSAESDWLSWSHVANPAHSDRLQVGNKTQVMPLAKAVAARVKELPESGFVLVETSLQGGASALYLRTSHLAQSLARAHSWQARPVDLTRPTRQFLCVASISPAAAASEEGAQSILQIAVFPEGPKFGRLPSSV